MCFLVFQGIQCHTKTKVIFLTQHLIIDEIKFDDGNIYTQTQIWQITIEHILSVVLWLLIDRYLWSNKGIDKLYKHGALQVLCKKTKKKHLCEPNVTFVKQTKNGAKMRNIKHFQNKTKKQKNKEKRKKKRKIRCVLLCIRVCIN